MVQDSMNAQQCVFEAIEHRLIGVSFEQFKNCLREWQFHPIIKDGNVCGAVMQKGAEVHIALRPSHQGCISLRPIFRRELHRVLKEHGYAFTWVMDENLIGHRLAKLLGFKKTDSIIGRVRYDCMEMVI